MPGCLQRGGNRESFDTSVVGTRCRPAYLLQRAVKPSRHPIISGEAQHLSRLGESEHPASFHAKCTDGCLDLQGRQLLPLNERTQGDRGKKESLGKVGDQTGSVHVLTLLVEEAEELGKIAFHCPHPLCIGVQAFEGKVVDGGENLGISQWLFGAIELGIGDDHPILALTEGEVGFLEHRLQTAHLRLSDIPPLDEEVPHRLWLISQVLQGEEALGRCQGCQKILLNTREPPRYR